MENAMESPKITADDITVFENWIPDCNEDLKPTNGLLFRTVEEGYEFYKTYALTVGFSVRLASFKKQDDHILYRYIVCSKQGFKRKSKVTGDGSKNKKRKNVKATKEGCGAYICLKRTDDGSYVVHSFVEGHNHDLASPSRTHMLRSSRNVQIIHKQLMLQNTRFNVGPSTTYRVISELLGGRQYVGCSLRDMLNYKRGLKALIKNSDAQMFIDNFARKQEIDPGFYYAYEIGDDDKLRHAFWTDAISRRNYALFGDVISFDSTFRTNMYSLVFTPFTGMNHHRQLVCFGAAFLADEKSASYLWLFEKFLEAMGGQKPKCIITDQDLSMKIAISRIFDTSIHRYCMWHILRKVSEKVGPVLNKNEVFHDRLKSCVWNSESPEEFESLWTSLMHEFELVDHDWFLDMFELRQMWIPAYFKDIFLVGILRTTSSSESENSFFNRFTNKNLSLVEFWMSFDHAIESQRYMEKTEDTKNTTCIPQLKTDVPLEVHAREIYSHVNFYLFQEQLAAACFHCAVQKIAEMHGNTMYKILDVRSGKERDVLFDESNFQSRCSCKMFESQGLPCCHILMVLKGKMLKKLPSCYVTNRWTKLARKTPIMFRELSELEQSRSCHMQSQKIATTWSKLFHCMHLASQSEDVLDFMVEQVCCIEKKAIEMNGQSTTSKEKDIQTYLGATIPEEVHIHPPAPSSNKGCRKRMKSGKEIAIADGKNKRQCAYCHKITTHDKRNCPKRLEDECAKESTDDSSEVNEFDESNESNKSDDSKNCDVSDSF